MGDVEELSGRELDAVVAEEVLGCEVFWERRASGDEPRCDCPGPNSTGPRPHGHSFYGRLKDYSGDMTAAWEVVEAMANARHLPNAYTVWVGLCYREEGDTPLAKHGWYNLGAEEMATAICRLALKAVRSTDS